MVLAALLFTCCCCCCVGYQAKRRGCGAAPHVPTASRGKPAPGCCERWFPRRDRYALTMDDEEDEEAGVEMKSSD